MKLTTLLSILLAVPCLGMAAPLINDASLVDLNWSSRSSVPTDDGFHQQAGNGAAPAPSVTGGKLVLSMAGSESGPPVTYVYQNLQGSEQIPSAVSDYIVTIRFAIDQFPGNLGDSYSPTITSLIVAHYDYLKISLTPTVIRVFPYGNFTLPGGLTNEPGKFYTWQFEVHEDATSGAGTVTIWRRDEDSGPGSDWTLIKENAPIGNYGTNPAQQVYYGQINYSSMGDQGAVSQEYLRIGLPIPEPSAAFLLPMGVGLLALWRQRPSRRVRQ